MSLWENDFRGLSHSDGVGICIFGNMYANNFLYTIYNGV